MTEGDLIEEEKPIFSAVFYMKSGSIIPIDNFTQLTWTRTGEEITKISWTQDLTRGSSQKLGFVSLPNIEFLLCDA